MPKNLFQDMVKINSTRRESPVVDISPPHVENKIPTKNKPPIRYEKVIPETSSPTSRYNLWVVAIISVLFLFFALSFLFAKAKITVQPRFLDIPLSENLSAIKDGPDTELSFDLVSISGEEVRIVQGGEEKELTETSKGSVIIYNTFSAAPQSLDINTRLEGSNGKIYKTDVRVVVPGMKAGGVPGSVEVGIHADVPGEAYNSNPLDFKIFGFKGTSKYEKFYARSEGSITGGLQGKFYTISEEEKAKVMGELETALQAKLLQKATDQIPDGFILFKDAVFLRIDDSLANTVSKEREVTVKIKGTLYGFLFNEVSLTKDIVKKVVPSYDNSPVHIPNIKDLSFALFDKENTSFKDVEVVSFKLSGTPKVVWEVDQGKLASDVLGKKKKEFSDILLQYPNIVSADVSLRPIWKRSFPEKIKDIKIDVSL